MQVNNHDVAGLQTRINRFIEECYKSSSSSTSQVNQFDQARMNSYLNAVDAYHDWLVGEPLLDLPETHPRPIELEPDPKISDVENESVNDIMRLMGICRDELVHSQSARVGSGLNKYDSARLTAVVGKCRQFMENYVAKVTPLDLPESSPQVQESGPGRTGINP